MRSDRPLLSYAAAGLVAAALFVPATSVSGQDASTQTASSQAAGSDFDSNTFGALRARALGPSVMSGRVSALDAVAEDPITVWVGAASGGVWKSDDGGTTFAPVFDEHTQSIGALRIDPNDPDTVWVGTGESWVRNSVSYGDGLYKTTDGGETWKHLGLEDTERIATIRIHPEDGDVVWVCALGPLFADSEARGVYKTTDGGETWNKVLYVDETTGCADIDVDPQEPDILYAGMWQFRRWAYFFESGGPGSGLYRSTDGGETWSEMREGLPEGDLGRIAVAVAPSRPNVVYATVEADETALYRSDDLGKTWRHLNASQNVQMRPFYFSELEVDPTDHQRVYKPGFTLTISDDGGESFSSLFGSGFGMSVHPDHHALWINPKNPHELILGTDGGVYISYDRAGKWNHVKTLPISQFYQVAADDELPYNVYGGLQDNGSWMGPSKKAGGVTTADWDLLSFGDGFWVLPDPTDPNLAFSEFQGGNLLRANKQLGVTKSIHPFPREGEEKLRFNWNSPMHFSPNHEGTLYYGSQYLHRSTDRGETWETISPDLTTDDPEKQRQSESGGLTTDNSTAENHCTIYTISESPVNGDVIWVGTDDGNVQVTRDGGATWTNVAGNVAGVPAGSWVTSVEASPHAEGTAFATFDAHWVGDFDAYVYRTDDFGTTWRRLGVGNPEDTPIEGYAHVIAQDFENPDLLFLGTEWGLWISLDGGEQFARYRANLPRRVAVHDVDLHERDHDLVIATHGRGIYILDDLTPLRALTVENLAEDVVLLPSRPAEMVTGAGGGIGLGAGDDEFVGEVPQEAASISYYLAKRHLFGDLKIQILDSDGQQIVEFPGGKQKGMNRVIWPMRYKAPRLPAATNLVPAFQGPRVPEGTYTVRLIKGSTTLEQKVELVPDRRLPYSDEDRKLQQEVALELYRALEDLAFLTESLVQVRDEAKARAANLDRRRDREALEGLAEKAEALRTSLVSTDEAGWLSGDEKLREDLGALFGSISTYDGRPTNGQLEEKERLMGELAEARQKAEALLGPTLNEVNATLEGRGAEAITPPDRDAWMAENSGLHSGGGSVSGAAAAKLLGSKKGRAYLHEAITAALSGL